MEYVCAVCNKNFKRPQIKRKKQFTFVACSTLCVSKHKTKIGTFESKCKQCKKTIRKRKVEKKKNKSGNFFCSKSCAAKYNNSHKTQGIKVSKLEKWLATKLQKTYPHLEFHFNRKDAINSELDIYIPSLKLAFELNGIFHYEPIFGPEKLSQIQNNDNRKFQACLENEIELCIIDTSSMKYFKEINAGKYLQYVKNILSIKMDVAGLEPATNAV